LQNELRNMSPVANLTKLSNNIKGQQEAETLKLVVFLSLVNRRVLKFALVHKKFSDFFKIYECGFDNSDP